MDYSFIRDNFDINNISESILSIQVSLDGFSFVISQAKTRQSPDYIYIKRIENEETESLNEALSSFMGFDSKEFYTIRIIVHEACFALVPDSLFDLRDMKAYLNLNHPARPNRKTISCEIVQAAAVCVFSLEESLYKNLKSKFPGADFCHSSLPFCSMAIHKDYDGCFIQVYENSMELAITINKKLVLYNIFELQGENDIVYYVLNAFKSQNLDILVHPLYIAGVLAKNSEAADTLAKYVKNIRFYSTDYVVIPDNGEFQYPSHYFLNHREILNCEL